MKWNVWLVISGICCLAVAPLQADPGPEALFEQGNAAYKNKQFRQAIQYYDSLLNAGYQSPVLFYNLGNACYKSGLIAKAILYYERARKLTGHWESLQYNLSLARERIADSINRKDQSLLPRVWDETVRYWPLKTWTFYTLAFAWLTGLGGLGRLWLQRRSWQRVGIIAGLIGLMGFGLCLTFTAERYELMTTQSRAVVTAPSVAVKSAPDQEGKDVFVLQGGVTVRLTDKLDNWQQIRLSNGKKGWVKEQSITAI